MPISNETPLAPIEIYGRAKKEADDLARTANGEGSLKTCCIRPRTIVGTGRLGIFEILFDWIIDNANIFVIGTGNHLFQFVHAEDLAEVSIQACLQQQPGLFNVGTDRFGTLRKDLAHLIHHAGKRSKIVGLPASLTIKTLQALDVVGLSPLGPWHYLTYHKPFHFDVDPVKEALSWQPKYGNQEILTEAYDSFVAALHSDTAPDGDAGMVGGFHKKPVKQGILKVAKTLSRVFG
jgi:nucleoside-diphosphate-sugar epimerase